MDDGADPDSAGACLRTASRVMMMSTVGEGSTLLEGTLVLAGDSSTPSSTWYGWPGEAIAPLPWRTVL